MSDKQKGDLATLAAKIRLGMDCCMPWEGDYKFSCADCPYMADCNTCMATITLPAAMVEDMRKLVEGKT